MTNNKQVTPRCVDVVVGLAAGSEAKGKLVSLLAHQYSALVRTGAANAAHTVVYQGTRVSFHTLPCGSLHADNDCKIVLGPAAQVDMEHLKHEIELLKQFNKWLGSDGKPRLLIDRNATIVDRIDQIAENGGRMPDCGDMYFHPRDCQEHAKLGGTCVGCSMLPKESAWQKLGSTTHGAGANMIRKMARGTKMAVYTAYSPGNSKWADDVVVEPVRLAKDDPFLAPFCVDTVIVLNDLVDFNCPVMLEGTQGSVLSLHHGYPGKTTSRDTNASNWCMEAGISPLVVRHVYGVTRTFPIRVAGNSGPMSGKEIDWDDVTEFATGKPIKEWRRRLEGLSGLGCGGDEITKLKADISKYEILEVTTATKRKRRVFEFGEEDFHKAIMINRPTHLCLTFVDYLDINDIGKSRWEDLSEKSRTWILGTEARLGCFFDFLSTGPAPEATIFRSK